MSAETVIQFPRVIAATSAVPESAAAQFVDSLLSHAEIPHTIEGTAAVLAHRVNEALTQLSPLMNFVISKLYPANGGEPWSHKQLATHLSLYPDAQFEPELMARCGHRRIQEADVRTIEAEGLRIPRHRPAPKLETSDEQMSPRRLSLIPGGFGRTQAA